MVAVFVTKSVIICWQSQINFAVRWERHVFKGISLFIWTFDRRQFKVFYGFISCLVKMQTICGKQVPIFLICHKYLWSVLLFSIFPYCSYDMTIFTISLLPPPYLMDVQIKSILNDRKILSTETESFDQKTK